MSRLGNKAYTLYLENCLFKLGYMTQAPCFRCGYNGPNYYQAKEHSCAKQHHKLYKTKEI